MMFAIRGSGMKCTNSYYNVGLANPGYVTVYSNNGRDNTINPTYLAYVDKTTLEETGLSPPSSAALRFWSPPDLGVLRGLSFAERAKTARSD